MLVSAAACCLRRAAGGAAARFSTASLPAARCPPSSGPAHPMCPRGGSPGMGREQVQLVREGTGAAGHVELCSGCTSLQGTAEPSSEWSAQLSQALPLHACCSRCCVPFNGQAAVSQPSAWCLGEQAARGGCRAGAPQQGCKGACHQARRSVSTVTMIINQFEVLACSAETCRAQGRQQAVATSGKGRSVPHQAQGKPMRHRFPLGTRYTK